MTLRVRFALWVAALLLTTLVVFGAFVYFNLAHGLASVVDDSLRLSASQTIAAVNIEDGQINFSDSLPEGGSVAEELRGRGLTMRILDPTGRIVQSFGPYRNLPVDADNLAAVRQGQTTFATIAAAAQGEPVRMYTAPIIENGQLVGIVQVAQSLGDVEDALRRLLAALLLGGPFLALLAALGSYVLAARALAPIDRITRAARRISAEDLSRRLNLPATNDEVGRLAATFDDMLGRLDEAFRRERQFTADASHELRTPLAAMQAILSVTRAQRRAPEDYEVALADLADEADRLRGLVENLLQLARGEGTSVTTRVPVDLSMLLADITDSLRPLAEAKGLTLICDVPPGLRLLGDGDALIRLFVNLLDNAIKYTEHGRIVVTGRAEADRLRVTVTDTGIGIPAEHLPHIFERFYRVDQARTAGGTGLGLALALEIARRHGGTIAVDSVVGAGTTFTVYLPTHEKTRGLAS